jgi:hypothetical protein
VISHAEHVLTAAVPTFSGFAKPRERLNLITRHPSARGEHDAEIELGKRVILIRGFAEPLRGLHVVRHVIRTDAIFQAQTELRVRVALIRFGAGCLQTR